MKTKMATIIALLAVLTVHAGTPAAPPTPAEKKIEWARRKIEKNPQRAEGYSELALALAQRARETSDTRYYTQAEEAVKKSLALAADNLEARKAETWILLGKHEFRKALELAQKLNRRAPDDVLIYGFLVDANVELGNYKDAEGAAQWMLDLRPGNIAGLTRTAYLREIFGDTDGAIEAMSQAYTQIQPGETEERAWALTQMAHLHLAAGKVGNAEKLLEQTLALFPDYHYALAQLAKVRAAQKRHADAVELLRQRYAAAAHPENRYDLAVALERAGQTAEATKAFTEFEKAARAESAGWDNANRELIFYYTDRAGKPSEALRIAEREFERRRDVHTLHAYAWALSANGKHTEARRQIEEALAAGIRDAEMLYHAGAIAARQNARAAAKKFYRASLEANPQSEVATAAKQGLAAR